MLAIIFKRRGVTYIMHSIFLPEIKERKDTEMWLLCKLTVEQLVECLCDSFSLREAWVSCCFSSGVLSDFSWAVRMGGTEWWSEGRGNTPGPQSFQWPCIVAGGNKCQRTRQGPSCYVNLGKSFNTLKSPSIYLWRNNSYCLTDFLKLLEAQKWKRYDINCFGNTKAFYKYKPWLLI